VPLCEGGADAYENLQWITSAMAKVKDQQDIARCREMRRAARSMEMMDREEVR
jgi:hypothetical protein